MPDTKKYLSTPSLSNYKQDLYNHPLTTLSYTPKIIHNTVLHHIQPLRDRLGLGLAFDMIGKCLKPIFGEKKDQDWFSNYFLFGAWINILKSLKPTPNFPLITTHFWGGIVGMLIQGYDKCGWQKEISTKYPFAAAAIGFVNGVVCCTLQTASINFFNNFIPFRPLAATIGFTVTWSLSSKLMCKIEEQSFKTLEKHFPTHVAVPTNIAAHGKSCYNQKKFINIISTPTTHSQIR